MRIACWIPKTVNKHSEYVILIASSWQQWLHERAKMLCCTFHHHQKRGLGVLPVP